MTENSPVKLAVIVGSMRNGRFGPTVANWFVSQAEEHGGVSVDLIDLAEYPLPVIMPDFMSGGGPDDSTQEVLTRLSERLKPAEAFVVVTPEYNHSVPASLKNAIDWFFDEWKAKPVGLISYGGVGGGLRAAEHLRQIFAEVHATTVRDMLSFHHAWGDFAKDGSAVSPEGSEEAAKGQLEQLIWWGRALREAKEKYPYGS